MHITMPNRPGQKLRPWSPQPGRLNTRERVRCAVTTLKLQSIESDWLFQQVSAEGRRRILIEHGLLPR